LKSEEIEKIFSENKYHGWRPTVLEEVDSDGNHLVRLIYVIEDRFSGIDSAAQRAFPTVKNPTRDDHALQLISNLQSLGVSFDEKTCIDVGCRSGENSLAMQAAGAKVIGIDPDDGEFEVAVKKGIDESQLAKATLQEYHESFPDNKFDIATVFLWNISLREREAFVSCLKDIIHPNGLVVIGYADELYDKDPDINVPALMETAFYDVRRTVFKGSLNRYVLVCSKPKT
jgi:2-polyprenyl-3-methyl-5-hydroxy-6-metoxy-1,4-benzoquinol methylase